MWRWGKRALLCVGGLAMGGIIYVLVTFLVNDFRIADGLWKDLIYYPTHSRMAVWLVGAMFGYILHQTKNSKVNHLPKRYYALGWATCFAVLGLIPESLSRPLFGTCVMWIIFACVNGHGGVVNVFLSSQLWQPLARLSYTMYLLHSVLLVPSLASVKTDSYFSVMDLWYRLCGVVGLTTSVSLVWSAVFEVPFGTLEKIAFGRQ
ncbi:hypothetical protein pipiens_008307 [Culex pipiens pipiens]|uniref:Acyltransferase 3 domain-containing protein n=1 Tax=Culex pipiens pipiens TaxID=38569 RepID=A0ABD1DJ83_CULPP